MAAFLVPSQPLFHPSPSPAPRTISPRRRPPRLSASTTPTPQILITGAPASGKGTQCALLQSRFNLIHLSTGDMLRAAVAAQSPLGKTAADFMSRGELVPDDLVIALIAERMAQEDVVQNGWLLDGFPRTVEQARAMDEKGLVPKAVVALEVGDEEVVRRVAGRRLDPETGSIYHVEWDMPADEEAKARLVQRSDDTEDKVRVRLELYHKYKKAILDKYSDVVTVVDGQRPKNDVFKDIEKIVQDSIVSEDTKKEPLSVSEFVKKAEEAFDAGQLGVEDVNWSGQAGLDRLQEQGESNWTDILRRQGLALGDFLTILAFASIGRASHGYPVVDLGTLKTAAPFLLGWFGVSPFLGAFTRSATDSWTLMARTVLSAWAVGVPLGLALRGLYLSHVPSTSFAGVTLVTTLGLLLSSRSIYIILNGTTGGNTGKQGGVLDGFRMMTTLFQRW